MTLNVFVHREREGQTVSTEKVAAAPDLAQGNWLQNGLDPYGVGRRGLPRGPNGERVLLEVRTEPIAHPVFVGGEIVDFRPDPRTLPGVA